MTENDVSTLREPFLPPVDDDDEDDEEHPQRRRCQTSSCLGAGDEGEHEINDDSDDSQLSISEYFYPPGFRTLAENNVQRTLGITFVSVAIRSIWSQILLSIFVVLVWKDRPEYVGYVPATIGLFQTMSSAATRWSASRSSLLANHIGGLLVLASLIGLAAMALSLYAIALQRRSKFRWFLLANGLWGVSWGMMESALPIVFVESASVVPRTTKQKYNMGCHLVRLGSFVGTLFTLACFQRLGNEWNADNCVSVLVFGVGFNLPVVVLLCTLRSMVFDWGAYDGEEESSSSEAGDDVSTKERCIEPLLPPDEDIIDDNYIIAGSSTEDRFVVAEDDESLGDFESTGEAENSNSTYRLLCCANNVRVVPLLINLADAVSSLAGGMSAWYFPVFLMQRLNLGPTCILFLYLIILLGQWLSPLLATILARAIGPCRACLSMQWTYVACLLSMILCQRKGYPIWTVCALYVLHGSLMNSTSSLSKAWIAHYVVPAEEEQHKWDLAETLQKLVWSCAGFVGGCVVGRWGLLANLYSTAVLQFLAGVPLVILYCSLDPRLDVQQQQPREEEDPNESRDEEDDTNNSDPPESISTCCKQTKKRPSAIGNDKRASSCTTRAEASNSSTHTTELECDSSNDSTASTSVV